MALDYIDAFDVGARLRRAREAAGLTQTDAAADLRVERTTLVAMEQGRRRVRTEELQHLARLYGTSVNAVLRREAVHVDLVPRFRRLPTANDESAERAARLLTDLVRAEVELQNLLGVTRTRNYPPARTLLPGDVRLQAENDATELRQWLGLGLAPVRDVMSFLELDLGVRLYVRPLDSRVSGLFAYDDGVGACILLNAGHPRERQAQTGVHGLGHLASRRQTPDVCRFDRRDDSREERYANAFGRAFLTPARTVAAKFQDLTAGAPRFTRRHVILLAHAFGVSREAMVRRLEELDLVKRGTWDWFEANGGITDGQAREVLSESAAQGNRDAGRPVSFRLGLLAAEAHRQELLSEGQLAQLISTTLGNRASVQPGGRRFLLTPPAPRSAHPATTRARRRRSASRDRGRPPPRTARSRDRPPSSPRWPQCGRGSSPATGPARS